MRYVGVYRRGWRGLRRRVRGFALGGDPLFKVKTVAWNLRCCAATRRQ
ncbi:hypothetical protein KCP77_22580 [Salmonella enterica subsp. enterica]|nr:hypothetical protein KCP77_22580 [Salmonella enterica subsp. enterica]